MRQCCAASHKFQTMLDQSGSSRMVEGMLRQTNLESKDLINIELDKLPQLT